MSLPRHVPQLPLFGVEQLLGGQFDAADRFAVFARVIGARLEAARPVLEGLYCRDNGRPGHDPVMMLGLSLLQFMERLPDRQAEQMLRYHLGWKLALGLELAVAGIDPTSLVYFRRRLLDSDQAKVAFDAILEGLCQAGLVGRRGKRRLDSTHVLGLVARLSRMEKLSETLRLALEELDGLADVPRPPFWQRLREVYVQSRPDWRIEQEQAQERCRQAGADMLELIGWLKEQPAAMQTGRAVMLLMRVFAENFKVEQGQVEAGQAEAERVSLMVPAAGQVANPHEPEATAACKRQKKWMGYKVQVCESIDPQTREPGEPREQFLTAVVTTAASDSDQKAIEQVVREEQASGLERAEELHVDSGYVSGEQIRQQEEAGTDLVGPMARHGDVGQGFKSERFEVDNVAQVAVCPAGHSSRSCMITQPPDRPTPMYRYGWPAAQCQACPLKQQCLGANQRSRTLHVTQDHAHARRRRQEQQTEAYRQRMRQRNAIEGTQSELVRGHGARQARYRGHAKVSLQNWMIGAACNAKRWIRLAAWRLKHAIPPVAAATG